MDEHTNQDIQEYDNPALTGSQSTRPPQRQRGARAQRRPTQTEILAGNVQALTQTVCPERSVTSASSRSRRSRINLSEAPEHPDPTGDNPDNDYREVVNVRRNTPSVFDNLGRPEIYRRLGREATVDKPVERESRN
ncbi:hypothetical protein TIFTF001_045684 [Ficus carica]|uniref:Uncharacterized protein n=1 Tax=Ficus carica TaxID=3494 RepID=A0AA87YSU2_FICCA|nr:hypothetical protein TIFTF001_045682 [Ficus carica]GMN22649.1 hypothetical protein TIFTF001_045684 [Ficus carica]